MEGRDGQKETLRWKRATAAAELQQENMVTFWLFCLAASALSSGRAAEEEEGEKAREDGGGGGAFA